MSKWLGMIIFVMLSPALAAQEALPDRAPVEQADEAAMAKRFPAPPLDRTEMESMYLESPTLVENKEQQGMSALRDQDRFLESDPLFQEQLRNSQDTITINRPEAPVPPLPTPAQLTEQVRQL